MSDDKETTIERSEGDDATIRTERSADAGWGLLGAIGAFYGRPGILQEEEERRKLLDKRADDEHAAQMAFYERHAESCKLDTLRFARGERFDEEWRREVADAQMFRLNMREHMARQTAALEAIAAIAATMAKEGRR